MKLAQLSLLVGMLLGASTLVIGQERWQRLPPARDAQFYSPRNKLEELEARESTLLVKGRTWVATLRGQGGNARVEATELRDIGGSQSAMGVTITIITSNPASEVRCLIDYEEIDSLVKAFDAMAKADDSISKLNHFEAHYRTRSDFEIIVFKQISGGIAAALEAGFFERSRLLLTLEDFTRLRWMVVQAKEKLDEIK